MLGLLAGGGFDLLLPLLLPDLLPAVGAFSALPLGALLPPASKYFSKPFGGFLHNNFTCSKMYRNRGFSSAEAPRCI